MIHPAFNRNIDLDSSNESGELLFSAKFKNHLGNPREVFFYSRNHETAELDLRILSETFVSSTISQHVASVDPSKISGGELRKRIEALGGIITDENAFNAAFSTESCNDTRECLDLK